MNTYYKPYATKNCYKCTNVFKNNDRNRNKIKYIGITNNNF